MSEPLFFNQLVTKSLQPISGNDRFFEGYLTVEVKDKQGELTIVDELIKVLPIWMDRGAPITDTHSNRVIGKGINYQKTIYKAVDGSDYPAIKIIGKIHDDYELDNEIWNRIKSGEYKGLSFGGATKSARTPFRMKDGSIAYSLKDLEHYEVAVCKDPAVPLALITDFNPLAKAMSDNITEHSEGKMLIQCSKFGCYIDKASVPKEESEAMIEGKVPPSRTEDIPKAHRISEEDAEKLKADDKVVDPNPEETDPEKIRQSAEAAGRKNYDMYKADLGSYDTFQGKVDALVAEGTPEENAKRIVGAFVKGEKKKTDVQLTGSREIGSDPTSQHKESQQITSKKTKSYKNTTNYINALIKGLYKDMVEESDSKINSSEEEEKDEEDKSEEKEAKKSFREAIKTNFTALTEVIQSLAETQKSVSESLKSVDERLKALETPTDLKATSGKEVKIPDEYQSNSVQASLDDDGKDAGSDKGKLSMQEKTFTQTPRPSASVETVNKSFTQDFNLVLKDARETGDLSAVGRNILSGKYYTPKDNEAWY